ncbi:MAG: CapA family protein [Alistipes sp.]
MMKIKYPILWVLCLCATLAWGRGVPPTAAKPPRAEHIDSQRGRMLFPRAPLATSLRTPLLPPRSVRMLFAGDLMQHLPQVAAARQSDGSYDYQTSLGFLMPLFTAADLAVVNLETTFTRRANYAGYPCFRSPVALADALQSVGVEVCVLANNHCCDGGAEGVRTTLAELDRCGIAHTGVFVDSADYRAHHPLRLQRNGLHIALLNYTYATNGIRTPQSVIVNRIDTLTMARDLHAARTSETDCVVVCIHWGNEYERQANLAQRNLAAFLRRHGADVIIGSHPHVVQPFEVDSAGVTFYSLGNLVSNQRNRYCDGGVVAEVCVTWHADRPMHYAAAAIPIWVQLPLYRVLTPQVADTLRMTPWVRMQYERFVNDTRELLEIKSYQKH